MVITNQDLILGLLGIHPDELPVAVFNSAGQFCGTQAHDEYYGIIDGVCYEVAPLALRSFGPEIVDETKQRPGESYPKYLQRKWVIDGGFMESETGRVK